MTPIDCNEIVELVTDYLEGTLPEEERERFEAHVGTCPGCEIYLEQMRQTLTVVGRLEAESLDPDVRDGLLEAFRGYQRKC